MIWIVSFILLVIIEIVLFIYLPAGTLREPVLLLVSVVIGALGFSIKDSIKDFQIRKKSRKRYQYVCELFNQFFDKSVHLNIEPPKTIDENISETEILDDSIRKNVTDITGEIVTVIKLCYYCKKWELNKAAEDYASINQSAESLGIKYAKFDNTVKLFAQIYSQLIMDNAQLNFLNLSISKEDMNKAITHFINNYYKNLQFFKIKDKFYQNKNLHETLIKIIKEGKLSTYGITNETIKRLEIDMSKRAKSSNLFVVFTDNTNKEDRVNLKEYLHNYARLGMTGCTTKMPVYARFGVYIIKTEKNQTPKSLLKDIKNSVKISAEAIVRIAPLNMIDSETYTLPFNQSFTNENLKKCYEALEWFKTGYDYSDSALWSEITKSSITPNELLSIIPFNIFCKGILPCEQEFIIINYDKIKDESNVSTLVDWAQKNPDLIKSSLLKNGVPTYSQDELKLTLMVNENNKTERIDKRISQICGQIVEGAKEFEKSLHPSEL